MPCTFTHPLAVVPLRRLCPARLNFAALVIGSMSPDFGYYIRQFPTARFAHTIPGTFAICLPTALLALGIFYLLRQRLCFILPQPHRAALMPLASVRTQFALRSFLIAIVSVLLGAWSHTIWDSFTHDAGWAVQHVSFLHARLIDVGGEALPVSYVLQQLSTFGGGATLALLYFRWLRRQPIVLPPTCESFSDARRFLLLGMLAVIALAIAAPAALRMASLFQGYTAFRVFVFRTGVYSAAVFLPLLILSSILLYAAFRHPIGTKRE